MPFILKSPLIYLQSRHLSPLVRPAIQESVNGRLRFYKIKDDQITWNWKDSTTAIGSLQASFRSMFLPIGYPSSVHPVYGKVHLWQFFETWVGSLMSVFCSQAMLSSVGVNNPSLAGTSAIAINWVLKDTLGEIMKLGFIQRFAQSFDSHPKTWKLVGEGCSLSGAILQLCTVAAPSNWFLVLAGLGYGLKSIHFSIWGATHMTFTRNFALNGNVGDLVAKDDSQISAAHLLGTIAGAGILTFGHEPWILFTVFGILGPIHLYMTLALLKATRFKTLNQTTLSLLIQEYISSRKILELKEVEGKSHWFGEWVRGGQGIAKITMGSSIKRAFRGKRGDLSLSASLEIFKVCLNFELIPRMKTL